MPYSIDISNIVGGTPPYSLYVCDENMNNCFLLGPTGGTYYFNSFFSGAQTLIIKIVDSTGCLTFKYIYCDIDTFFILTETELIITTESGDELVWI